MNLAPLFFALANGRDHAADLEVDEHLFELMQGETLTTMREALNAALKEVEVQARQLGYDKSLMDAVVAAYTRACIRMIKLAEDEGMLEDPVEPVRLTLVK